MPQRAGGGIVAEIVMDQLQYGGKRVVVTGAASGIGEATCVLLGELGADVIGLDINEASIELAASVTMDLRDPDAIQMAAEKVGSPVDALLHCAGLPQTAPGLHVFLAGFVGPRQLTEAILPQIPAGGAIVCVASTAAYGWVADLPELNELLATPDFGAAVAWCEAHLGEPGRNYALTKGAMIAYTARRGLELAARGVRINCVAPGPTATPMTAGFRADVPDYMPRLPLPMGRMADPREQAWVFAFLGSPRASFVTGSTVFVDGGYVAGLTMGLLSR
jgi:NAD(P)-dependent dehydrogenase (short-subunit alcohol dehydrogenase family)